MKTPKDLNDKARADIIIDLPFFGSLVVALSMVENKEIAKLRFDGEKIEFNPDYVQSIKHKALRTNIARAVMHGAFGHQFRQGSREPVRYNKACAYAICNAFKDSNQHALKSNNAQLRDYFDLDTFKDTCPPNEKFENLCAEEIYNMLPPTPSNKGNGAGSPPPGQSTPTPGGQPPPPDPSLTNEPVEVKQSQGNPDEIEEKESQWKVKVIQAANAAKQQGTIPSTLQRLVDDIAAPTVPWKDQLRQFFNVRQRDDFSWRRPKNSMIHQGIYLPSLDSVRMGAVVVAVDTSGSITDEVLKAFQSEVQAVVDECCPAHLVVLYCDAAINKVSEYAAGDIIDLKAVGGGGTDFQPVFRYVEKEDIDPCCLVYLTDLMGSFPKKEPEYPVLWGCVLKDHAAPFGETIYVNVESDK